MPSTTSILKQITVDYPEFNYKKSDNFSWSHEEKAIYYNLEQENEWPLLLHELAHGLLKHDKYSHSINLLQIERDAWDYATIIARGYGYDISEDSVESSLDTYRHWLHKRSTCPKCEASGIETDNKHYLCPECHLKWKVNDARSCALRRYKRTK